MSLSIYDQDKISEQRDLSVYKRDDMVQHARYSLTVQEQRAVLYAISKIKPEDDEKTEYSFELKDFYNVCGIIKDTYTTTKRMLKALGDKSWWVKNKTTGGESLVRWFNTIDCDENSGRVVFKFHERMMPYLVRLVEQNEYYTSYKLKYVLPMSSKHSPRLYEILKSYQKNNQSWFFHIDDLKYLMDAENYKNFNDFKKRVLDPAVEEINKYTDICIRYEENKRGRKVERIFFYMDDKTFLEKKDAENKIQEALDGQLDLFDLVRENQVKGDFLSERQEIRREERRHNEESKEKIKSWLDPNN